MRQPPRKAARLNAGIGGLERAATLIDQAATRVGRNAARLAFWSEAAATARLHTTFLQTVPLERVEQEQDQLRSRLVACARTTGELFGQTFTPQTTSYEVAVRFCMIERCLDATPP